MRRKIFRVLGIGVVAFVIVEIGSCQIYDAVVKPSEADGLIRNEISAPNGYTVSFIKESTTGPDTQPRILYVHGSPGDATAFDDYLVDPIAGFESLSLDRPGFGFTRPRKPVFTLAAQAECIEPLLVDRGGMGTILVGHSLGGPIVVQAALDYPDRVGGVVILSGSLDPSLESIAWYQRLAEFAIVPYMVPYFVRNANRELLPLKAQLEALRPRLKQLRCPVVIVHAPDDILVPFANVAYMRAEFPKECIVDVMQLDGKSHWVPWNAEADVRAAIEKVARAMQSRIVKQDTEREGSGK